MVNNSSKYQPRSLINKKVTVGVESAQKSPGWIGLIAQKRFKFDSPSYVSGNLYFQGIFVFANRVFGADDSRREGSFIWDFTELHRFQKNSILK